MIPVTLTLRNFMSYGDERTLLDLSGVHVACLSGDNGNGKWAILDAMTYALWGKTRATGSAASGEDDLIRLGAQDMEVQLDFRLGDDVYRTIRKRSRRTGTGDWQVQLSDGNGTWRSIGGGGGRGNQENLARILRGEGKTVPNFASLHQGHPDAFIPPKTKGRKDIPPPILDPRR